MQIRCLETGAFAANCYLVSCEQTGEGILIDPGAQAFEILQMVRDAKVKVKFIVNTHGHIDHIGANAEVMQALGVPLYIHEADSDMVRNPRDELGAYKGIAKPVEPGHFLKDGDKLTFGTVTLQVLATPGHSRGSVCLYDGSGVLFTGDTLFAGSIGRTDFPGGSFEEIMRSIKGKLLVLPDDTVVYPGHGPATTVGEEKKYNPFLQ
ncbi:MAG: MBL fold metallo-hydrolase [Bacillota bacterium]|nr:MBL fold metallo-hydrolase [Bacillota bacterium]HHU30345.1 MBL fold metallo-hydrolase [Bacillota bacterium]